MAESRSIHSFFLTAPNQHRPFCDLAGRTAQPCPSPALCALFPHPLQNRVPWGERAPVALCRAGLGSRLGRCWALPTGEQHPSRQARQVRLSISIMLWRSYPPFLCSIASFLTRPQPFPSPPAPKTHPVSPFSGFSGCVFLFFAVFGAQNFCLLFCASCRIAVTS